MHPTPPDPAPLLPSVLGTVEVRERYGLRDNRGARVIMHEVGVIRAGNRLFVRADDLDAWERREAAASRRLAAAPARVAEPRPGRSSGRRTSAVAPLEPGWWREGERCA